MAPLTFAAGFWLSFWILPATKDMTGAWLGASILAAVITFFWTLGWGNAIRYGPTHVSVTNLLLTSRVAWTDVRRASKENGLTIVLRDVEVHVETRLWWRQPLLIFALSYASFLPAHLI